MISLEKWEILTPLQKLPKNVGDLAKLIVAKGIKWLPKVRKIAQSGHTGHLLLWGFRSFRKTILEKKVKMAPVFAHFIKRRAVLSAQWLAG